MFGTVIRDCYSKEEVGLIVKYLDDLCNPNDGRHWGNIVSGIIIQEKFYTLV